MFQDNKPTPRSSVEHLGELTIHKERREVRRDGQLIHLRRKEYDLLLFLLQNKNRVLNQLTILEYVWNYSTSVQTNTLQAHMAALRRKLERGSKQKFFRTIHGLGYQLCDDTVSRLGEREDEQGFPGPGGR